MLQQDYLMRLVMEFAGGIRRALERAGKHNDPSGAAALLESAVGEATDLDGDTLLSLAPESIATIMEISGTDPKVTEFMARSLLLASRYYEDAGEPGLAELRAAQAFAIAEAYGHVLAREDVEDEGMEEFLDGYRDS